jgi:two-component sensor histidine kinase
MLLPKRSLAMHMIIHGLATNATRYGALNEHNGRISVRWSVEQRSGSRWLALEWKERCEREVPPPGDAGFGSRLIEQSVDYELHGEIEREFSPTGLVCTKRFPLDERNA